jgi:hypothetical protein
MNRRRILGLTSTAILQTGFSRLAFGQPQERQLFVEEQSGDPELPLQRLAIDLHAIEPLVDPGKSIGVKKDAPELARRALQIAIKDSQRTPRPNDKLVEEYLNLFGVQRRNPTEPLQPFCAAGLSHAFCRAYCDLTPQRLE